MKSSSSQNNRGFKSVQKNMMIHQRLQFNLREHGQSSHLYSGGQQFTVFVSGL